MDENQISGGDAKSKRRNFLSLAVAATAGAIASLMAKSDQALAGHDGTNVFHLGEANEATGSAGLGTPTRLRADVDRNFFRPPGVSGPAGAGLMVFNGDASTTKGKGFAILGWTSADDAAGVFGENGGGTGPGVLGNGVTAGVLGQSHTGPGVEGISGINSPESNAPGVRGSSPAGPGVEGSSDSGDGVFGSSNTGAAVRAEGRSPSQPALVANWRGPSSSPHSGVAGSSSAGAGVHGLSPTEGVVGQASELIPGGISLTSGTGVRGESGSGPGVLGTSGSGPGVQGSSGSSVGVQGFASQFGSGIHGVSSQTQAGVAGQSNGLAPAVLGVHQGSSGNGVEGRSLFGLGVWGESENKSGVAGQSFSPGFAGVQGANLAGGPGVKGVGGAGPGVHGSSQSGPGVQGFASQTGPGVEGFASTGTQPGVTGRPGVVGHASSTNSGVRGDSNALGPGVIGEQLGPGSFAIWANAAQSGAIGLRTGNAQGGIALDVSGRARFTTAGNGTVPAKADSLAVSNPAVQANSNVIATLTSDPGDAQIAWVERNPGSGFVLHMTKKVGAATSFAYLITESA